jgi:hypothetical protein
MDLRVGVQEELQQWLLMCEFATRLDQQQQQKQKQQISSMEL